ncbi:hypothetical protein Syun_007211 [Stephania yunnanensis]|uniref:Uncharacterized protein n=1 Tax=Stephania yunnanensis TaxID=152371 RepID=A0AAP0PZ69_9MAGN
MKGKESGGRVVEEGSHDGNEIEELHESVMPFVLVERGSGVAEDDDDESGDEIDRDDDDDGTGDSDCDDDESGNEDEMSVNRVWRGWFAQSRDKEDDFLFLIIFHFATDQQQNMSVADLS